MLNRHNSIQDESGFWMEEGYDLVSGMAGAAHNYHLYCYHNLSVPNYRILVDNCLDENAESDVSFIASDYVMKRIMEGKTNPVMAYATKKLSLKGDMTKILKLQNLF